MEAVCGLASIFNTESSPYPPAEPGVWGVTEQLWNRNPMFTPKNVATSCMLFFSALVAVFKKTLGVPP